MLTGQSYRTDHRAITVKCGVTVNQESEKRLFQRHAIHHGSHVKSADSEPVAPRVIRQGIIIRARAVYDSAGVK